MLTAHTGNLLSSNLIRQSEKTLIESQPQD